jgi:protein gp37
MGDTTKIEWCDKTFNPWVGCTKISPACDHCYAESWAKRTGSPQLWNGKRRRTTPANWRKPLKWDREAAELGVRYRVFCASLADVFDNAAPLAWRTDLFRLIHETPNLDWQLLTKRIGNVPTMLRVLGDDALPQNVWLGSTVVNQDEADRDIPKLLAVPAAARSARRLPRFQYSTRPRR